MNNQEKSIIFNRADEYRRAALGAERGSSRHESFSRKHQAIKQVIDDLGMSLEYVEHLKMQVIL